jgi:hypothetical protein
MTSGAGYAVLSACRGRVIPALTLCCLITAAVDDHLEPVHQGKREFATGSCRNE